MLVCRINANLQINQWPCKCNAASLGQSKLEQVPPARLAGLSSSWQALGRLRAPLPPLLLIPLPLPCDGQFKKGPNPSEFRLNLVRARVSSISATSQARRRGSPRERAWRRLQHKQQQQQTLRGCPIEYSNKCRLTLELRLGAAGKRVASVPAPQIVINHAKIFAPSRAIPSLSLALKRNQSHLFVHIRPSPINQSIADRWRLQRRRESGR